MLQTHTLFAVPVGHQISPQVLLDWFGVLGVRNQRDILLLLVCHYTQWSCLQTHSLLFPFLPSQGVGHVGVLYDCALRGGHRLLYSFASLFLFLVPCFRYWAYALGLLALAALHSQRFQLPPTLQPIR